MAGVDTVTRHALASLLLGLCVALTACSKEPAQPSRAESPPPYSGEQAVPGCPAGIGPPIEDEGLIYTPIAIDAEGCVQYHVCAPGGVAPTALAYRDGEGRMTYGRPQTCWKSTGFPMFKPASPASTSSAGRTA